MPMDIDDEVERTFAPSFFTFMTCWPDRYQGFLPMIQNKDISPKEIMDTFFQRHPKPTSPDEMCTYLKGRFNGLLCHSVFNDRNDIIEYNKEHLSILNQDSAKFDFNLLVVAAYCGNVELIRMLISFGYHADRDFKCPAYINNRCSVKTVNGLDIALQKDNVNVLEILRTVSEVSVMSLLKKAISHQAETCFQVLLANADLSDRDLSILYFQSVTKNSTMLKTLIKHGFSNINTCQEDGETAMHIVISGIAARNSPFHDNISGVTIPNFIFD